MPTPFTIRIFLPDGDPEGVRIIDRMNWTGKGIVFPRQKWLETREREEFERAGVYILVGYKENDELPTLYVGQADGLRSRIDAHSQRKEFWSWACAFVSTVEGLNRAHITWLEWALINRAIAANRSNLDNGTTPQEPGLSEAERADTSAFLEEVLQILPLVGLRAFDVPRAIVHPDVYEEGDERRAGLRTNKDTIVVPAQRDGFEQVFLGENRWRAIRISGGMLPRIKWIAAYQTQPISAITHYAEVDHIEPYGEEGKYQIVFKDPARPLERPIPFGDAPGGAMQGPRYTTFQKLQSATRLTDLM